MLVKLNTNKKLRYLFEITIILLKQIKIIYENNFLFLRNEK